MFYVISKLFWLIVQPVTLILIMLIVGIVLSFFARTRTLSRWISTASVALLGLAGTTNVGALMLQPLENRFQRVHLVDPPDGIIILGGGIDAQVSGARNSLELGLAGDRILEFVKLARTYPETKILVTGGVGQLDQVGVGDGQMARSLASDLNLGLDRMIFETQSRNTTENAINSKQLVPPVEGEYWVLVTSAFHMPRSMGVFRQQGWNVLPWPVDYYSQGNESLRLVPFDSAENITQFSIAVREWIGLLAYNLTGQTDAMFPAPQ